MLRRPSSLGYVPALDGLRGIAISAVVLYHFFGLPGGYLGVDLFFVLSGFLITTLLVEDGRLGRFYKRRARRLLPALAPLLIVFGLIEGWQRTFEGGFYLANFFRAFQRPDQLAGTPFDHLWSLATEEQFYLVWPVILAAAIAHRRWLRFALASLFVALVCYRIALLAAGAPNLRVYFGPDTHADGLALGCLAALIRPRVSSLVGWLSVAVVFASFAFATLSANWLAYGLPVFEIASVLAVLAAADGLLPQLRLRPLVWLGLMSYSLYLWHEPVRVVVPTHPWIGLAIAFALAIASYRFVEKPFRRRREPRARNASRKGSLRRGETARARQPRPEHGLGGIG